MNRTLDLFWVAFLIVFSVVNADPKSGIGQERDGANDYRTSPAILARPNRWGLTSNDNVEMFNQSDFVALASGSQIRIVNLETGKVTRRIDLAESAILRLVVSGNDQYLAVTVNRAEKRLVIVLDSSNGEVVSEYEFASDRQGFPFLKLNYDGSEIVLSDGAELKFVNVHDKQLKHTIKELPITAIGLGCESSRLALLSKDSLIVRDGERELRKWNVSIPPAGIVPQIRFCDRDESIEIFTDKYWKFDLKSDVTIAPKVDAKESIPIEIGREGKTIKVRNMASLLACELEVRDEVTGELIVDKKVIDRQIGLLNASKSGRYLLTMAKGGQRSVVDLYDKNESGPLTVREIHFLPGTNRLGLLTMDTVGIWADRSKENGVVSVGTYVLSSEFAEASNQILLFPYGGTQIVPVNCQTIKEEKGIVLSKPVKFQTSTPDQTGFATLLLDQNTIQFGQVTTSRSRLVPGFERYEILFYEATMASGKTREIARFSLDKFGEDVKLQPSKVVVGEKRSPISVEEDYLNTATSLFLVNREIAFVSRGESLNRLTLEKGKILGRVVTEKTHLIPQLFDPSSNVLVATDRMKNTLYSIDADKMEIKQKADFYVKSVLLLEGKLAVGNSQDQLIFFDRENLQIKDRVSGDFQAIAVSPDKQYLAIAGSDGALAIESIAELRKKAKWEVPAE